MPNGIISFVQQDIADGNPSTTEIAALEEQYYLDVSKGKYVIPYGLTKEAYRNCLENLYLYGTIEGAAKLVYKADFADHLRFVQKFDRDVSKGIVGGHNMDEFYNYFRNVEKLQDSDFIHKITKHPSIDGISQIEYKVPKLDNQGKLTGEYKYFKNPKTVYDPSKISNNQIAEWGKAAMEQGFKSGNVVGRKITGIAPNGLKFEGYMDADGIVTNFYPKLD